MEMLWLISVEYVMETEQVVLIVQGLRMEMLSLISAEFAPEMEQAA